MAYCAITDLIARYGNAELLRLTTDEGQDFGVIDQVKATAAIADASAEIDSYLRRRYQTPVTPTTPELLRACCALSRFELAHGAGREPTTQMQRQRDSILKWLERVRDGLVFLDGGTAVPGVEAAAQMQDAGCPVFNDGGAPSDANAWPLPEFWSGPI
jgi:phage gp36-like protein